jgi:antitoxin MazE
MQTQVKKWGNSLALRIPKAFAEEIAISSDSPVEISIVDGALVVVPIPEPQLSLEELLAEVSEDNLHREVNSGGAVGNEVW